MPHSTDESEYCDGGNTLKEKTVKYGYHCKFCGFTFNSDDKKAVKQAKQQHNLKVPNPFFPLHGEAQVKRDCPLKKTKRGTLVRAQIA